jgi:hypothetical protein
VEEQEHIQTTPVLVVLEVQEVEASITPQAVLPTYLKETLVEVLSQT